MHSHIVEAEYELSEFGILVGSYEPQAALAGREAETKQTLKLRHWRKHHPAQHPALNQKVHAHSKRSKVLEAS